MKCPHCGCDTQAAPLLDLDPPPAGENRRPLRGMRLPIGWKPNPAQILYARQVGCPDPDATAQNFYEYWGAKSGKDATKTDWNLTWQTWCRRERQWQPKASQKPTETFDQRRIREGRAVISAYDGGSR